MAGRPRRDRPCAFIDTHTMDGPDRLRRRREGAPGGSIPGSEQARAAVQQPIGPQIC